MSECSFQPLLFGGDINVYSVARAFHEAYGVKSIAFGKFAATFPCAYSAIIDYRVCPENEDMAAFRRNAQAVAEELEPQRDQVPLIGTVAAGSPILAEENVEEYLTFDTGGRTGEHFALKVRGESMLYAGILPDDLVIVHRQENFRNGDIVVALFEDEATVKTYQMERGHLWLMPENPDYEPIDGEGCALLGRVVAVLRRY